MAFHGERVVCTSLIRARSSDSRVISFLIATYILVDLHGSRVITTRGHRTTTFSHECHGVGRLRLAFLFVPWFAQIMWTVRPYLQDRNGVEACPVEGKSGLCDEIEVPYC